MAKNPCEFLARTSKNAGIETGQILFVMTLVLAFLILKPVLIRILRSAKDNDIHWTTLTTPASYAVACVASYWMIDRVSNFWA